MMMRRTRAVLLLAVLVAGASPTAEAAKQTVKTPRQQTYLIVAGLPRQCALSTDPALADPSTSCRDSHAGVEREALGGAPLEVPALDGVPLKLDVFRKITGRIRVESSYLVGYIVGPYGVGRPQLRVGVVGLAEGKEVLVGLTTTEAWTITPLETEHVVEFEIAPDPELRGVELHGLTLTLEIIGASTGHELFSANGQSTLTIPVAASAKRS
jgi:hypothetical protein